MKKRVLSLPLAIAMSLSGCMGDDTTLQNIDNQAQQSGEMVIPAARIVYDPTAGRLSVPNDLLFSGTIDGTLEMPDETMSRGVNGQADYSDPGQALGILDGWSTQNPFVLDIDYPPGYGLGVESVSMPGAVRLFEVKMGGDPGCESVTRGLACQPVAELTFGVDFVTSASGNSVVVAPLKPLKASTTYLVVTTDMLKDSGGRSIESSSTYELVRLDINTKPLATPSQLALQGSINSYEAALKAMNVDLDTVTFSAAMTTQSAGDVLFTVKTLMAAGMQTAPESTPVVMVEDTQMSIADVLVGADLLSEDNPLYALYAAADYYAGSVTVPYYLGLPSNEDPMAPVNVSWKAACDNGVAVQAYAAAMGNSFPYPLDTAPLSANDGMCIAISGGNLRDFTDPDTGSGALDNERHLTQYNLIPRMNGVQTLDVQMSVPDLEQVNMIRQLQGLPVIEESEAGHPVVVLVHGVGSRKEDMLAAVANLNFAGFATVAVDLPLHGSRGFDVDADGIDDINATTVSPTHYFNLSNLPVARDNFRQSVSDMLALRLGLNFIQGVNIDLSQMNYLGISLGGIVGSAFVSVTNTPSLDQALGVTGIDAMFKVNAAILSVPGGGLANLLMESPAFGPLVQAGVVAAAGEPISEEFLTFMNAGVADCLSFIDSQDAYLSCAYQVFSANLAQTEQTEKLAQMAAIVAQFTFAAQSVTDAGDPNNLAHYAQANGSAVLITEVVGDGMENLSDQVIPNQTVNAPIGGTEPLIRAHGLATLTASASGTVEDGVTGPLSGAIRFTKGHHSSLLSPSATSSATDANMNARVTAEMQNQAVSYFLSKGTSVTITDGDFILGHQ